MTQISSERRLRGASKYANGRKKKEREFFLAMMDVFGSLVERISCSNVCKCD